jgi:hypothetical protein
MSLPDILARIRARGFDHEAYGDVPYLHWEMRATTRKTRGGGAASSSDPLRTSEAIARSHRGAV